MDDLIAEFLVETQEGLEVLGSDLIQLEKDPNNKEIISNLFRVMHTIKGTCGFLGLSRLERIAHAGEDVMDKVRSGEIQATADIVSIILEAVDHIKTLVAYLEEHGAEEAGDDSVLVAKVKSFATKTPLKAAAEPPVVKTPEKPADTANTEVEREVVPVLQSDSADLQALFDNTPCLVDVKDNIAPVAEAKDSASLQDLFDNTACLVEMTSPPVEVAPVIVAKNDDHKKNPAQTTIRVNINILEELMQQASELVLTRNQLLQLLRSGEGSVFSGALQRLNNITTALQEGVMKTRMQPVGNAWTKLPRIVRDLSMELGKKIELKMTGEDTELDRQLLEMIGDPLTHMVRNSADHGIELPEIRKALGKAETGTINICAYHGGGYIIIEIFDDGKGINPEIIKKKAIEKGLVTEAVAANMSKSQILQFIFAAGFSTAEKVTSVSGRGVGMDVVKNNIEKISGTVELDSEVGKGSKFTIRIPLTLAIMSVLKLEVEGHKFAIPQINVREVVKAGGRSPFNIESLDGSPVLRLRGRLLPLVNLTETLGLNNTRNVTDPCFVIICELGNYSFGTIVDKVLDTEEIVVKPVSPILKSITIYSGSTILGDGSVILILEPNSLAKASGEMSNAAQNQLNEHNTEDGDLQKSSFVIFEAGDATPKVAPLELLSRLEEIDVKDIEYSRGIPVVQYRGELMHLIKIDTNYQFPDTGMQELLVISDDNHYMGLVVTKILDIVKAPIKKKISGGENGFLGPLVIDGKTCDVIDISYYFNKAFKSVHEEQQKPINTNATKILLVDDSPFFRKFIPPELEAAGFAVTTVASGKDAIIELEKHNYAALVTDMTMPGMNGQELALLCKKNTNLKKMPIIALSADRDGLTNFTNGKIEGIDAFVTKTKHAELIEVLQNILKEKAL